MAAARCSTSSSRSRRKVDRIWDDIGCHTGGHRVTGNKRGSSHFGSRHGSHNGCISSRRSGDDSGCRFLCSCSSGYAPLAATMIMATGGVFILMLVPQKLAGSYNREQQVKTECSVEIRCVKREKMVLYPLIPAFVF